MDCNGRNALSYTAGHEKIEAKNKELEINADLIMRKAKTLLHRRQGKMKPTSFPFASLPPHWLRPHRASPVRAYLNQAFYKKTGKHPGLMFRIGMSTSTAKLLIAHCQTTNIVWWSAEIVYPSKHNKYCCYIVLQYIVISTGAVPSSPIITMSSSVEVPSSKASSCFQETP